MSNIALWLVNLTLSPRITHIDQLMDETIDVVISQDNCPQPTVSDLQSQITKMRVIISQQSLTIDGLTRQMSRILAYLELGGDVSQGTESTGRSDQGASTVSPAAVSSGPTTSSGVSNEASAGSWTVVGKRRQSSTKHATVTTAAVAAVYFEEAERNRRSSSMVMRRPLLICIALS